MTAKEIRKWHKDLQGKDMTSIEVIRARARIEIAAQLAEFNEAHQPRWVWFTYNSHSFPLDANKVVAVGMRDNDHTHIYLSSNDDPWVVYATVKEVCEKLGIPVEDWGGPAGRTDS